MELRQLQYFIAVAETLNFRKAAEQLHLTQPPLSRQIRQLEEALGVELLVRDRRQVSLTESGRLLLQRARRLLAEADDLTRVLSRAEQKQAGRVRVGVGISLGHSIRRLVAAFAQRFPGVDVQYQDISSGVQNTALRAREIDVGLLFPPVDSVYLASEALFRESFRVILSKTSALAKRRKLHLNELAGQVLLLPDRTPGINKKVLHRLRQAGVSLRVLHTSSVPHEAGAMLVTSGKGIYVLPGTTLRFPSFGSGIVAVRLAEPFSMEVRLAWRKKETSVAVLNFLQTARQVFKPASSARSACS